MSRGTRGRLTAGGWVPLALAGALVATLIAGACGGKETSKRPAAGDPCRLFTRAELRQQFNVPPKSDKPSQRYPKRVRPENSPAGLVGAETCGIDGVFLAVGRTLARESYAKWKGELRDGTATVTTVKGLGEEATWVRDEFSNRLVVLDGDIILAVADTTRAAHGLERARSLAAKALAEL